MQTICDRSGRPAIWSAGDISLALTLIILALASLLFFSIDAIIGERTIETDLFQPELREYVTSIGGFKDISAQKYTFLFWFFASWLSIPILLFMRSDPRRLPGARFMMGAAYHLKRNAFVFLLGLIGIWVVEVSRENALIWKMSEVGFLTGVVLVSIMGAAYTHRLSRRIFPALSVAAIPIVLLIMASGLFLPPTLSFWPPATTNMSGMHYTLVMGLAEKLASGQELFVDVYSYYGTLPSVIAAAFEINGADIDWGTLLRTIQVLQVTMGGGLILCLAWIFPGTLRNPNAFFKVLMPFLLVLPFLYGANYMNWFPNQTGWRYLGFTIVLVAFVALRHQGHRCAGMVLGGILAIMPLYNLETGIACAVGIAVYLATLANRPELVRPMRNLLWVAPGFLVSALLIFLLYWLAFSEWPTLSGEKLIDFMMRFNQGFGSLLLRDIDALAILIFAHTSYILFRTALIWRDKPLSPTQRIRVSIAAVISVWLAYYVNRPQTYNLWTHQYFYCMLLATHFDGRRLALAWKGWRPRPIPTLLPAILAVALMTSELIPAYEFSWQRWVGRDRGTEAAGKLLSGVWLNKTYVERTEEQISTLQEFAAKGEVVYFTPSSFVIALESGVRPHVPVRDPFWEATTRDAMDSLIAKVNQLAPDYILFDDMRDDAAFAFGGSYEASAYEALKKRFARTYSRQESIGGWDVWTRSGENGG